MTDDDTVKTPDLRTWANELLQRGVEFVMRGSKLIVWPRHSYKKILTQEDRVFLRKHRDQLIEMLQPPALEDVHPPPVPVPAEILCFYGCGTRSQCNELREVNLSAWQTLHNNDPKEVERRRVENTDVMVKQMHKGHDIWH